MFDFFFKLSMCLFVVACVYDSYNQRQNVAILETAVVEMGGVVRTVNNNHSLLDEKIDRYYDEVSEAFEKLTMDVMVIDLVVRDGLREYIKDTERKVKELENVR